MISRINIAAARAHRDLLIRMGRPVPNGVNNVANMEANVATIGTMPIKILAETPTGEQYQIGTYDLEINAGPVKDDTFTLSTNMDGFVADLEAWDKRKLKHVVI